MTTTHEQWGVEIYDPVKGLYIETEAGGRPLNKEAAFHECVRWKGYGYDTRRVMRRTITEWEPEDSR